MSDAAFEHYLAVAHRIAGVSAARIVRRHRLPTEACRDLEQESLLELWLKRAAYDQRRGSWRTFAERVITNRLASLLRAMHAEQSGTFKEQSLEGFDRAAAPEFKVIMRADVLQVLLRVSPLDRVVALCLMERSAIETSRFLGISRAKVYRVIARLRSAFTEAGFARHGVTHASELSQ